MVSVPRQWPSSTRVNPSRSALICVVALLVAGLAGALTVAAGPGAAIVLSGLLTVGVSFAVVWRLVVTAPAVPALRSVTGPFVDLCLFAMCLTFSWSGIWRGLEGLRLVDIPLVILFVYGLLRGYPLNHRVTAIIAASLFLVLVGTLMAATQSANHLYDAIAFARIAFVIVVVPFVFIRFVDTPRRMQIVLLGLVLSGAVGAVFAILRRFLGLWVLPLLDLFGGAREYGLSDHPVMLGIATSAVLLLIPVLMLDTKGALAMIALLCAPVLLVGLVLSQSRAPMLGLMIGGAILVLGLYRHAPRTVFPLAWGATWFGILVLAALPGLLERLAGTGTDLSSLSRLKLYRKAIDDIAASPVIGQGAGLVKGAGGLNPFTDAQRLIEYATAIAYGEAGGAHNVWLQIWFAMGWAGLVGYALITLAPVAAALVIVREGRRRASMYAVALLAAYSTLLVAGMLYSTVFDRQVWLVPALILALWVHRQSSAWEGDPALPLSHTSSTA